MFRSFDNEFYASGVYFPIPSNQMGHCTTDNIVLHGHVTDLGQKVFIKNPESSFTSIEAKIWPFKFSKIYIKIHLSFSEGQKRNTVPKM